MSTGKNKMEIIYEKTFSNKNVFFMAKFTNTIQLVLQEPHCTTTFANINKKDAEEIISKLQEWVKQVKY